MITPFTKNVFSTVPALLLYDLILFPFQNLSAAKSFLHKFGDGGLDPEWVNVHGGWSVWSSWAACEGVCGGIGRRIRRRQCNNPSPANGGLECVGPDVELRECQLPGCTMSQFKELVQNDPLKLAQFQYLEAVHNKYPSLAERCVEASCHLDVVRSILVNDFNSYWNALHCIQHGLGCPVAGGWSKWSEWSECSASMGTGVQYSLRTCSDPNPSSEALDCIGEPIKYQPCVSTSSIPTGEWSSWSPWSECSVSCGHGVKQRIRKCLTGNAAVVTDCSMNFESLIRTLYDAAQNFTAVSHSLSPVCAGPSKEFEVCKCRDCPVNGEWSEWGSWSVCSAECGVGTEFRSRTCSEPPPKYGGALCMGKATEARQCFLKPCPVSLEEAAVFYGNTTLCYSPSGQKTNVLALFFLLCPFSPNGIILRRFEEKCFGHCSSVIMVLRNGFLHFIAKQDRCKAVLMWPSQLDVGSWFQVFIIATSRKVTMNINDLGTVSTSFSCQFSRNEDMSMIVGETFKGLIKKFILNFLPIQLKYNGTETYLPGLSPFNYSNLSFETVDDEDGGLSLSNTIHVLCPPDPEKWKIIFVVKPMKPSGLLFLMPDEDCQNFIALAIDSRNIVFSLKYKSHYEERKVSFGDNSNGCLYVKLGKSEDKGWRLSVNGGKKHTIEPFILDDSVVQEPISLKCTGDMFFGNIPKTHKETLRSFANWTPVDSADGWLTLLQINNQSVDLSKLVIINPSRGTFCNNVLATPSFFKSVLVAPGETANLTCPYNTKIGNGLAQDLSALWLRMGTIINPDENPSGLSYQVHDNGSLSELSIKSNQVGSSIQDLYSCWVQPVESVSKGTLLVSFGVNTVKPLSAVRNKVKRHDKYSFPEDNPFLFFFILVLLLCLFACCCIMVARSTCFRSRSDKRKKAREKKSRMKADGRKEQKQT